MCDVRVTNVKRTENRNVIHEPIAEYKQSKMSGKIIVNELKLNISDFKIETTNEQNQFEFGLVVLVACREPKAKCTRIHRST